MKPDYQINESMIETFEKAREMMKTSYYELSEIVYYYCKVKSFPDDISKHLLFASDSYEKTVVTSNLEGLDLIERNENEWLLLDFKPSISYMKGTILHLALTIFNTDSNILVISTYTKDYILIKKENKDKVVAALLRELGLRQIKV